MVKENINRAIKALNELKEALETTDDIKNKNLYQQFIDSGTNENYINWLETQINELSIIIMNLKKKDKKPRINQLNAKGHVVNNFVSVTEASNFTGINRPGISMALNGSREKAGGFFWEWIKEDE